MASNKELSAWLLPIAPQRWVAVGQHELKHIEQIAPEEAPNALGRKGQLQWHDQTLPLADLGTRTTSDSKRPRLMGIVAYHRGDGADLQLGAIALQAVPELVAVDVNEAQTLRDCDPALIDALATHAAFTLGDQTYPVLDLPGVFAEPPHESASPV